MASKHRITTSSSHPENRNERGKVQRTNSPRQLPLLLRRTAHSSLTLREDCFDLFLMFIHFHLVLCIKRRCRNSSNYLSFIRPLINLLVAPVDFGQEGDLFVETNKQMVELRGQIMRLGELNKKLEVPPSSFWRAHFMRLRMPCSWCDLEMLRRKTRSSVRPA